MTKKKRPSFATPAAPSPPAQRDTGPFSTNTPFAAPPNAAPLHPSAIPGELGKGDWTVLILAVMMVLTPALGVPYQELLQDTLKSMVVSFGTLAAILFLFWNQRNRQAPLRWHPVVWLSLLLMVYALGSMVWSHTYLAGVEAIRWFIFSIIVWLTLNTLSRERLPWLATGIQIGAFIASIWAALQFWFDFGFFAQGPNPASTFVNRNFFAEFIVCTLPLSAYLLTRSVRNISVALLAFSTSFNLVAMFMTGTRSALLALFVLLLVMPVIGWRYRKQLAAVTRWDGGQRILAGGVFVATLLSCGLVNSDNPKLLAEQMGTNALERAYKRAMTLTDAQEYEGGSVSVRREMWISSLRMIEKRPLSGVGAGAWEVHVPLYQDEVLLERDFYAHNEFLQVLAEYGLVGWLFVLGLLGYVARATWRTFQLKEDDEQQQAEGLLRASTLAGLLALFVVSNVGFPWRLATTAALFALFLGILAASDARLAHMGWATGARRLPWRPMVSQLGAIVVAGCLALACYISQQAIVCEDLIVRATQIAVTVGRSGQPNDPKWAKERQDILNMLDKGIRINPHYRKVTPMVGDALAQWGAWGNAVWVWESVHGSRPYVGAIIRNIVRGYLILGEIDKAKVMLERGRAIAPNAAWVRSLDVITLMKTGQNPKALVLARQGIGLGKYDDDLLSNAYTLAMQVQDWDLAIKAITLRNRDWPQGQVDGHAKLGNAWLAKGDSNKALEHFRLALDGTPPAYQQNTLNLIPQSVWPALQVTPTQPTAATASVVAP